jgi:hypothetical protein
MIIVKLRGGLGNQMFQYAFGKALSMDARAPLLIDITWYKNSDREFLLRELNMPHERYSRNRLFMKTRMKLRHPKVIRDSDRLELKDLVTSKQNLFLEGNWESPKYFAGKETFFREIFVLKDPSLEFTEAAKTVGKDSIAVHVRRGDYLIPHGKFLNGKSYYEAGVERIIKAKGLQKPMITIFSDDPEWCRKEMGVLAGCPANVFAGKLGSDAEELMLMSLYGNNVISNSTFSWWSAFLNKNDGKMVVMPADWFTDKSRNAEYVAGVSVPGWITI